jgi:signal transduction histidine kinase
MSDVKNYSGLVKHAKNMLNRSGAWTWDMADHTVWWSHQLQSNVLNNINLAPTFDALFEVTHEDDRYLLKKQLKELAETGTSFQTVIRTNGNQPRHFILINAEILKPDTASPGFAIGTMADVTEELGKYYSKQEYLLSQNIAGSNFGTIEVLTINEKTAEVLWSDSMFELLGYEPGEFTPTREHLYTLIQPSDIEKLHSPRQQSFEIRLKTKGGGQKWFLLNTRTISELDSLITRDVSIFTDIHYLKQNESLLVDHLDELNSFVDHSGSFAIVMDHELNIIFYNSVFADCFAPVRKKIPAYTWSRFFADTDTGNLFRKLRIVFGRNSVRQKYTETILADKDGDQRHIAWYTSLITYNGKQALLCSGIDLSPQHQKVKQLVAHNKQLKEFAHMASHNLRGPINNSISLINLYKQSSKQQDKDLFVEKLEIVTRKLLSTIDEFSQILKDTEKAERHETIDLHTILSDTINLFSQAISETQAKINGNFEQCPSVTYKKIILESVFQNLVSNSIKYRNILTPPQIEIRSGKVNDRCVLTFKDNGSGIDMEKHGDKLFGLYNTFHKNNDAQGVGLYLIKTQIEELGGRVSVQSEPGKGTEFTIVL